MSGEPPWRRGTATGSCSPRGLATLLPRGCASRPRDWDDVVAQLLLERWLARGRPARAAGAQNDGPDGEDIVAAGLELVIRLEQEAQQGVLDQGPAQGGLHPEFATVEGPAEAPLEAARRDTHPPAGRG